MACYRFELHLHGERRGDSIRNGTFVEYLDESIQMGAVKFGARRVEMLFLGLSVWPDQHLAQHEDLRAKAAASQTARRP
jgi:hypothetical protein